MRRSGFALLALLVASPLLAQPRRAPAAGAAPAVAIRPFLLVAGESFAATETFQAVFGSAFQPLWGGGVSVALRNGLWMDLAASRFRKTGERAFFAGGQSYGLGIPLTATITPFEISGGYRYHVSPRIIPYGGGGFGSYAYSETSDFADAAENVDVRHSGVLVLGGAEVRLHRWVGVAGDVQYTHVGGILGDGGVSKQAGESDLGGVSLRVRLLVGR